MYLGKIYRFKSVILMMLVLGAGAVPLALAGSDQSSSSSYLLGHQPNYYDQSYSGSSFGSGYYWYCDECPQCCNDFVPWYKRYTGTPAMWDVWAARERLWANKYWNVLSAGWQAQLARDRLWESRYYPSSAAFEVQSVKDRLEMLRMENDIYRQYASYAHYNPHFDMAVDEGRSMTWAGFGDGYSYRGASQGSGWDGPIGYDPTLGP